MFRREQVLVAAARGSGGMNHNRRQSRHSTVPETSYRFADDITTAFYPPNSALATPLNHHLKWLSMNLLIPPAGDRQAAQAGRALHPRAGLPVVHRRFIGHKRRHCELKVRGERIDERFIQAAQLR